MFSHSPQITFLITREKNFIYHKIVNIDDLDKNILHYATELFFFLLPFVLIMAESIWYLMLKIILHIFKNQLKMFNINFPLQIRVLFLISSISFGHIYAD